MVLKAATKKGLLGSQLMKVKKNEYHVPWVIMSIGHPIKGITVFLALKDVR